jgi:hypothetical protein
VTDRKEDRVNGEFRLEGMFGDELEEAAKNKEIVALYFSKGPVVRGIILDVDRRFAVAKILHADRTTSCVKLGYIINMQRKPNNSAAPEESATGYMQRKKLEKQEGAKQ